MLHFLQQGTLTKFNPQPKDFFKLKISPLFLEIVARKVQIVQHKDSDVIYRQHVTSKCLARKAVKVTSF